MGSIIGLAQFLNAQRPRRRPPPGLEQALADATEAVRSYCMLPVITRGMIEEGAQISNAYEIANTARRKLHVFVDDGVFIQNQRFWAEYNENANRWRDQVELSGVVGVPELETLDAPVFTRVARAAYYAAHIVEKAAAAVAADDHEMSRYCYAHSALMGTICEMTSAGIGKLQMERVEHVWRFVAAAGRYPVFPDDNELLDAFEAAIMVGADEFARTLVRDGYGAASGLPGEPEK
jgi:hypothetical protein